MRMPFVARRKKKAVGRSKQCRKLAVEPLEARNLLTAVTEVRLSIAEDEAVPQAASSDRQVLTSVVPGQTFRLELYLTDLRTDDDLDPTNGTGDQFGTFAAYTDVTFDPDAFTVPSGTSAGAVKEIPYPINWRNVGFLKEFVNADGSVAPSTIDTVTARYPNDPRATVDAENGKIIELGSFLDGLQPPGRYRLFQVDVQFQAESLNLVDDTRSINDERPISIDVLANDDVIDGTYTFTPHHPSEDGSWSYSSEYLVFGTTGGPSGTQGSVVAPNDINYIPATVTVNNPATKQDLTVTGFTLGSGFQGTLVQNGNSFRYTPARGATYVDTFTYEVSDGHGNTRSATVTVDVTEAPPVIRADNFAVFDGPLWALDANANQQMDVGDYRFGYGLSTDVGVTGDFNGDGYSEVGIYRNGTWILDANGNQQSDAEDIRVGFGGAADVPVVGDWNGDGVDDIGVYRNGLWILDSNGNWRADAGDVRFGFGLPTDIPVVGNWDGAAGDEIGLYRSGLWLLDANANHLSDGGDWRFGFGLATDQPVSGDWNADGQDEIGIFRDGQCIVDANGNRQADSGDTRAVFGDGASQALSGVWREPEQIGLYRSGMWVLDTNSNRLPSATDMRVGFGAATDETVPADWNGDGAAEIGIYRRGLWILDSNANFQSDAGDIRVGFGLATDTPVVGDWNGDWADDIGVYRGGTWILDSNGSHSSDGADARVNFGLPTDIPVTGDWDGDGDDDIGVYRSGLWILDSNGNHRSDAGDLRFGFGLPSDVPVTGDWNGDGLDEIGLFRDGAWILDTNGNRRSDSYDSRFSFGVGTDVPVAGQWASPPPLLAAAGLADPDLQVQPLTAGQLAPVVDQAVAAWLSLGLTPLQQQTLESLTVQIADLPGARLGQAAGRTVTLDTTAAGWGWLDSDGGMDLLTVVMHEMGHTLGLQDRYDAGAEASLMGGWLDAGQSKTAAIDGVFAELGQGEN